MEGVLRTSCFEVQEIAGLSLMEFAQNLSENCEKDLGCTISATILIPSEEFGQKFCCWKCPEAAKFWNSLRNLGIELSRKNRNRTA